MKTRADNSKFERGSTNRIPVIKTIKKIKQGSGDMIREVFDMNDKFYDVDVTDDHHNDEGRLAAVWSSRGPGSGSDSCAARQVRSGSSSAAVHVTP